ncbi:putative peptidyl-tRNA hydrolase 2 [Saccoglossus kowalevskii]
MVFVVNSELNMGIGKSAAQVGHASIALYRILLREQSTFAEMLFNWEDSGETKIVVSGENAQHLTVLQEKALSLGLPQYLVRDAGKTQIPSGSVTVLVMMGLTSKVDTITGDLKLL